MKIDLKFYIILGLLLALIISILTRPTKEIVDLKPYETAVAIADAKIKELTAQNSTLLNKVSKDSIRQAENRSLFIREISGLKSRLGKQRVRIDTFLVQNPEVANYVATADSVIAFQSARIDSLESDKAELRVDVREITSNFEAQLEAMRSKLKSTEEIAGVYKSQVRKEKTKVKVWRVATVVGIVGSLWIGSQ